MTSYGNPGSWQTIDHRKIADTNWNDKASVAMLAHELWRGRDYKQEYEKLASEAEHWLRGNHRHSWDKKTNRVVPMPVQRNDDWRARVTYNEVGAQEEYRRSTYTQNPMSWNTSVGTDDLGDKAVNRLTDQVMNAHWTLLDMDEIVDELIQWAQSSAKVYLHCFWDASAGPYMRTTLQDYLYGAEEIVDPIEKQDYIREQSNRFFQQFGPQAFNQGFYEGPVGMPRVEVAPIFEVIEYPFFGGSSKNTTIWMRTKRLTYSQGAQLLGTDVETLRSLTKPASRHQETTGSTPWNLDYFFSEGESAQNDDSMFLHILYHVPCKDYPFGRFAMVPHGAQEAFGEIRNIPSAMNEVPLIPCCEKPVRGSKYGTCSVDQTTSVNESINTAASLRLDCLASRTNNPILRAPGAGKKQLTVRPGAIIDVPDINAYKTLETQQIPNDLFQSIEQDRSWIQTLGGVTATDYGQASSGTSARGMIVQQQISKTRLGPFGRRTKTAVDKAGCFVLADLQEKCITERIAQLGGDDNRGEIVSFRGEDLQPSNYQKPGYNKNCVTTTGLGDLPQNPSEVMNFIKIGLETPGPDGRTMLDPVEDRDAVFEMLGMRKQRNLFDKNRLDISKCKKLIKAYESGNPMAMQNPFLAIKNEDAHEVFVKELEKWKKTDDFKVATMKFQQAVLAQIGNAPLSPEMAAQIPTLDSIVDQRIEDHRIMSARKMVEPLYLQKRADLSLWMQHRSETTQMLAAGGMKPDEITYVVEMMFPVPLSAMPQAQANEQQNNENAQAEKDRDAKKNGKPGQPKKSGGSDKQGVTKQQQKAEAA